MLRAQGRLRIWRREEAGLIPRDPVTALSESAPDPEDLEAEATQLANMAVEQVEQVVGPLDRERALIYQDEDGGFTCGSVGRPPIPIPWPPPERPAISELLAAGVVDGGMVELIRAAGAGDVKLTRVFEDPARVAEQLGVEISEQGVEHLRVLSPAAVEGIEEETDREIVRYFHEVIEDGRHVGAFVKGRFVALVFEARSRAACKRLLADAAARL